MEIFRHWRIEILKKELEELSNETALEKTPVIILGRTAIEHEMRTDGLAFQKYQLILEFVRENGYSQCFQNEEYCVFVNF